MRLPGTPGQRLIALCVVLAIPTGIAVWSKVHAHGRGGSLLGAYDESAETVLYDPDEDAGDSLRRYAQRQAAMKQQKAAMAAALQADADRARAHLDAVLPQLVDVGAGEPGPLIGDISLVRGRGVDADHRHRLDQLADDTGGRIETDGRSIDVRLPATAADALRRAVEHAWGRSSDDHWYDLDHDLRATLALEADGVHLRWAPSVVPGEMIVPTHHDPAHDLFPAVGVTLADALPRAADDGAIAANGRAYHYALGAIGEARDPVEVDVDVDPDRGSRVTGYHIHTNAPIDADNVIAVQRMEYGAPLREDATSATWRRGDLTITASRRPEGAVIDVTRAR